MSGSITASGFPGAYAGAQQMVPQGLLGNILGAVAAPVGGAIGGIFGHQQLGQQIGSAVAPIARFIPLSADTPMAAQQQQQPQFDPQFLGGLVNIVRHAANAVQTGIHVVNAIKQVAPGILPLALGDQAQAVGQQQQMAPQGLLGDFLGSIAAPVGGAIGGLFGNPQLGQQIGNVAGQAARFIPLSADTPMAAQQQQQPQFDPQFLGGLVNIVRHAANAVQTGLHVVNAIKQVAPGILPLALGDQAQAAGQQQMAPQTLFGPTPGIRPTFPWLGQPPYHYGASPPFVPPILHGTPTQPVLPFAATAGQPQMAPQGILGSILGAVAAPVGGAIGGMFGHQQLGHQIGTVAGQAARFLPLSAETPTAAQQPPPPQFNPQFLGGLVNIVRQAANAVQTGLHVVNTLKQVAPGLLPLALADQAQAAGQQQMAPQGLFGDILGTIAAPVGAAFGGPVGGVAGGLAGQAIRHWVPFSTQPDGMAYGQQPQMAPQGVLGDLLGSIAQPVGNALGSVFGNQQLGGQIGQAVGQAAHFLPLSAQQPWVGQLGAQMGVPQQTLH